MNQPVTNDPDIPGAPGKRRRLLYLVGGGVLALALIGWLVLRPHGAAQAATNQKTATVPPLITVVVPQLGPVSTTVSVTGQISARNDIPIGVEGDEGRIAAVLAEPGDRVHKGQVLARLNPITAQTQVDSASASLDELKATAAVAEAEWARTQRARDSFSVEEAERRRTSAVTAEAKVKAAEAQLADAQNRMAHTTVLAPEDGIVLTRTAEVGQIAVPGTTILFRLARNGEIELRGQVAEQEMPLLKVGQVAEVRLDGVPHPFAGKVWQIGAIIDPTTRQGMVRIALPAADQNLRPGAFARADIQSGTTLGAIVPQTAVLSDEQGNYAMIVNAQQKIERRAVTVAGTRSEGLLVSAGLTNTDRVVAIAGAFLRIDEQVVVAPSPGAATAGSAPASHSPSAP
jgi:RND family efflux transporter MFP subunit